MVPTHIMCRLRGWTYPRVLMNPLVDPSAYREQMSPMCRKLDSLSDIFDTHGEHLQRRARGKKNKKR